MKKIIFILAITTGVITEGYSQSNFENSFSSLKRALTESVSLYDIPGGALWLSSKYFPIEIDKKFYLRRLPVDRDIQEHLYVPGSKSIGSTDPHRYPDGIFLARMTAVTASGLIFGNDTYDAYKHSLIFYKAVMYNYAFTELFKNLTHRNRPDRSDDRSFFSGHTSSAFVTSTFLYKETSELISENVDDDVLEFALKAASFSAFYGWAGYVGYSRIRDNKHYMTDVLTGAAAGTLIGLYFYNHYFNEDKETLLDNFNVGVYDGTPVLNMRFSLN